MGAKAAKALKKTGSAIRQMSGELGRGVDGGWRAEQKAAALSAWMFALMKPMIAMVLCVVLTWSFALHGGCEGRRAHRLAFVAGLLAPEGTEVQC